MKKINCFLYLVIILMSSCTVGYEGSACVEIQGIYEVRSKVSPDAPVFRFDSQSDSLTYFTGSKIYLEFYDLNSKQMVQVHQDSYNYECNLIEENVQVDKKTSGIDTGDIFAVIAFFIAIGITLGVLINEHITTNKVLKKYNIKN